MGSLYNKLCVITLVLVSYAAMALAFYEYNTLINHWFITIGLVIGGIACFIGQTVGITDNSISDSLWEMIDRNDDQLVVLNKHILVKLITAPFYAIVASFGLFDEWGILALLLVAPVVIFGVLIAIVQVLALIIASAAIFLVTYVAVILARLIYGAYYKANIKRIVCDRCGALCEDYTYVCPSCHTHYDYLEPGQYGILHRRCRRCKSSLSVTPWKKYRYNLHSDDCGDYLSTNGSQPITISVAGTCGAGKTSYMVRFGDRISKSKFNVKLYNDSNVFGGAPTNMGFLPPYIIEVTGRPLKNPKRVFFYDISGREFNLVTKRDYFQKQYRYNNGLIFFIDSIKIRDNNFKGIKETEDAFDTFLMCVKTLTATGAKNKVTTPLAIVITKQAASPNLDSSEDIERYLASNELSNMVNNVRYGFSTYRYFVCDSKTGNGLMEPASWIISFDCRRLSRELRRI